MKCSTERAAEHARTFFNAGRYEEAAAVLERAYHDDLTPEDAAYLLLCLGYVRRTMGDTGRAIEAYQTALARNPIYHELHARLGTVYRQSGQLEEAERCYGAAIQNGFAPFWVYTNLGRAQIERGDYAGAHVNLDTALLLNPNDRGTHEIVGFLACLEKDWVRALAGYERAAALNPDRVSLHVQVGDLLLYERRYSEAAQAFRRALAQDPTSETAQAGLRRTRSEQVPFVLRAPFVTWANLRDLVRIVKDEPSFPEDDALTAFKQAAIEQCVAWFGPSAHPDWPLRLRPSPFAGAGATRHQGEYAIYINSAYANHEHRFGIIAHELYHYVTLDRRRALRRFVWVDEMLAEMTALRLLREHGMNDLADRRLAWLQNESGPPLPLSRLKRARRNRLRK